MPDGTLGHNLVNISLSTLENAGTYASDIALFQAACPALRTLDISLDFDLTHVNMQPVEAPVLIQLDNLRIVIQDMRALNQLAALSVPGDLRHLCLSSYRWIDQPILEVAMRSFVS